MNSNKYKALKDWLLNYNMLSGWIDFNVLNIQIDNVSLNSVQGERIITEYLDGTSEKELLFAIDMVETYDTGTSNINVENIQKVEDFANWIEKQNIIRNLPSFDGCIVNSINVLDSAPGVIVETDLGQIRYQFQGKVNYLELKGE